MPGSAGIPKCIPDQEGARLAYNSSNRLPPFVALPWKILNSRAYKELRPSAGKALPYFLGKVKVPYNNPQKNRIEFDFSYTEAKKYGFAYGTHHRTICGLVEKGFIDPVDKGGLRGCGRSYNLFRLSERWTQYGTKNFIEKDWRSFFPKL